MFLKIPSNPIIFPKTFRLTTDILSGVSTNHSKRLDIIGTVWVFLDLLLNILPFELLTIHPKSLCILNGLVSLNNKISQCQDEIEDSPSINMCSWFRIHSKIFLDIANIYNAFVLDFLRGLHIVF